MKYTRLAGFEKHLQAAAPNNFSQLYAILAKDAGDRSLAVEKLTKYLLQGEPSGVLLKSFSAKDTKEELLLSELSTLTFLDPKKILHISDIHLLKKPVWEKVVPFFVKPLPGFILILSGHELKGEGYKKVEKCGVVLELAEEKPWEKEKTLQEWLAAEVQTKGKKISSACLQAFVKAVSPDCSSLLKELEKVLCYMGERAEVTIADLQAVVEPVSQDNIWQLCEALLKRSVPSALKIAKGLLSQEVSLFLMLRQVRGQFQMAFQAASLRHLTAIKQEFPHMKETTLEKHLRLGEAYGLERFPFALQTIDDIEFMAKNGADRYDILSDLLILKLTSYERITRPSFAA